MNMTCQISFQKKIKLLSIMLCLLLISSCDYCGKIRVRYMTNHQIGRTLDLSWPGIQLFSDSISSNYELNKPISIVAYIDDKLCGACFSGYLRTAEKFVNKFHSDSVQYVCITYPRSIDELQQSISKAGVDSTKVLVIYDSYNMYLSNNSITKMPGGFNVFLIDDKRRIKLLGDPIRKKSVFDLYKPQIESMLDNNE